MNDGLVSPPLLSPFFLTTTYLLSTNKSGISSLTIINLQAQSSGITMNILHSTLSTWRDRLAPVSRTSTFRTSGQITPEEFILAGDYLVYKFPSWSWSDASSPAQRVSYLPPGKQFLVTRGVPCHRRLNDNFAGDAGHEDEIVQDMLAGGGDGDGDEDGWLRTGGGRNVAESQADRLRDVRTVDESGNLGEREEEEEEIPDMEDDDDDEEAIIREPVGGSSTTQYVSSFIDDD